MIGLATFQWLVVAIGATLAVMFAAVEVPGVATGLAVYLLLRLRQVRETAA